ncbi:hypothetical protein CWM92_35405, partial [Klebsiella michiganensis]
ALSRPLTISAAAINIFFIGFLNVMPWVHPDTKQHGPPAQEVLAEKTEKEAFGSEGPNHPLP